MIDEKMIRTMEAGREMDALIAEKVMGWKQMQHEPGAFYDGTPELVVLSSTWTPRTPHRRFLPSTDIASAWEVVEKLATIEGPVSVAWGIYGGEDSKASVQTMFGHGPGIVAPTAPLAICRAALLAVNHA